MAPVRSARAFAIHSLVGLWIGSCFTVCPGIAVAGAQETPGLVDQQLPSLLSTYKTIHSAPELSHHEEKTSALLALELRRSGFEVTEHIGKYPDGSQAFGLIGILKNGDGPTLLVRADMDALPVIERTGLAYASSVHSKNPAGQDVGVMHACGHDIHITTMIGVARVMAAEKARWHGTLMLVGQPSEETIDGAKAMLADHLYERFGTPDMAIALHDSNLPAGKLAVVSGYALASSTSIDVVMKGVGAHGAQPQSGKDPIMMAAEFIVDVQTVVSRSIAPQEPAVITVGDIHGGTKRNIIPEEVRMELTTRAFNEKVRQQIIEGVKRTALGVAIAGGMPEDRMPVVTVRDDESTPAMYNDPALAARLTNLFLAKFGKDNVVPNDPIMGSEDFGIFGLEHKIPTVIFWLGAYDPAVVAASVASGKSLPSPHSPLFAPLPEPTLRMGVTAMSDAAIALLQ